MMTVLSGILLLLCVSVCQALLADKYGHVVPIGKIFPSPKRVLSIPGVEAGCYKNFYNYKFDQWKTLKRHPRVKNVHECNLACEEREDCKYFLYTQGFGRRSGCTLAKDDVRGIVSPIYSRSADCSFKNCTLRGDTYSREHQIFLKKGLGALSSYTGISYDDCHARCKNYSGNNGFSSDIVDWKRTYFALKPRHPHQKIPCGFSTYHFEDSNLVGTCMLFARKAFVVHVSKTAGPTKACRTARETRMKQQLNDSKFTDYKGAVLTKSNKLAHFPYTVFPEDCYNDCHQFSSCKKFLVVHGMLKNSGCWLFDKDARRMFSVVKSGEADCNSTACLASNAAYGSTFEIVLKPQYEIKESGIWKCQQFCANHSGQNSGFAHHELDWTKSGGAIEPGKHWYQCVGFTYTAYSSWFDKKCMIFGKHATQLKIVKRFGTVP